MKERWWSEETILLSGQVDPNTMPLTYVIAIQRFDKKDAKEMSVRPGDRIIVTPRCRHDDWYEGRNDWTGQNGEFPKSCGLVDIVAVQLAQKHHWLAPEACSRRGRPICAPGPSRQATMEFWGRALNFGNAVFTFAANMAQ